MFKDQKLNIILFITVLVFLILFSIANTLHGKDRCQEFLPEIRNSSLLYLGPSYPYWYNVGCAIAETSCRSNIVSFDGGIGLYQFTPSTGVTAELKKYGMIINPKDAESSIKGQAFYIKIIRDNKLQSEKVYVGKSKNPTYPSKYTSNCGKNLADYYRFYNGGYWFVYESSRKQGIPYVCDNTEMRKYCVRGGTTVGGKYLSFCDVNYSYPEKVYNYGRKYSNGLPDQERFWYSTEKPKPIEPKKEEQPKVEEDPIPAEIVILLIERIKPFAMNY